MGTVLNPLSPAWQALNGEGEGGIWARESAWIARSRALIPFPFPFEILPRRLKIKTRSKSHLHTLAKAT